MATQLERVKLTDTKATALLTLYARARQSRSPDPVLPDPWAEQAIARIDYPFEGVRGGEWRDRLLAARARQLDDWTREFLAEHPQATVLHLGCGLDSRAFRIEAPAGVRWLDVDYPETIALRRRLYPERPGYTTIGVPLTDLAWLDSLLAGGPVLALAEGVFMYLTEDALATLLRRVVGHFSSGRLACDVHSRRIVRLQEITGTDVHGTGARFRWGMRSRADIPRLEPRLRFRARRSGAALAEEVGLAWPGPLLIRIFGAMTCLLYEF